MQQLLPRGFQIEGERRVTRKFAGTSDWEIYETNQGAHVLVVTPLLFNRWVSDFALPQGIFQKKANVDLFFFSGNTGYLVASLENGPFPDSSIQVEAFSLAFNTASRLFPKMVLNSAVYLEEYSLLLPTIFDNDSSCDAKMAYGKWLCGGVPVPVDSFNRLAELTSWFSETTLRLCISLAGFTLPEPIVQSPKVEVDTSTECDITANQQTVTSDSESGSFHLIGRPELERFFRENIIDIVLHLEDYKRMGIDFPGATVLHGPPGCGKTYAVEQLSEYLGWKRFDIDANSIASSYIHETSKKISDVFNAAMDSAPSILVIDEMEAFLSNRNMVTTGTHHTEEVAEFLRRIPEAISKGVLIFAMTNMIDTIDPAVLRRGRFDHIVEVKMACADEIESLLALRFNTLPVDETVDAKTIAKKLDRHPLSDVSFVLREAGRIAVLRKLAYINAECFETAIAAIPKEKTINKIGFSL